ncbi:MAG: iron-containing alcohol dehydrogenase [Candidatus Faecivicinus sp.]
MEDDIPGGNGKGRPLPVVAITATAETGGEVDQWSIVSRNKTSEKIDFGGYGSMFPVLSIVDPELMTIVSPMFTAFQGFDELFHSTEVYIFQFVKPFSDMLVLQRQVHQNGADNVQARLSRRQRSGGT